MRIVETIREMKDISDGAKAIGKSVVLVPTMGFLHEGHRKLLKVGRHSGDVLVLSIFVNPIQFGQNEDLSAYPRDLDRDLEVARNEGVDVVFIPRASEVYPKGFSTYVNVEGLTEKLCGLFRPGHFRGVTTVVLKLFNIVRPHRAVFGRKDYQQFKVVEKMVQDLALDIDIIGVDTVREPDGLAMSSRNAYLDPLERKAALVIPVSLDAAVAAYAGGERDSATIIEKMKEIIEKESLATVEYIKVCDSETMEDLDNLGDYGALVALAVRIGKARLIDNRLLCIKDKAGKAAKDSQGKRFNGALWGRDGGGLQKNEKF